MYNNLSTPDFNYFKIVIKVIQIIHNPTNYYYKILYILIGLV
jgi:hypothetical protein